MSKKPLRPDTSPHLAGVRTLVPHDDEFRKLYPVLSDILWPRYQEGRLTRIAGWAAVKLENGLISVKLVAPTDKLETIIVIDSLVTMWQELESSITLRRCHWVEVWSDAKKAKAALDKAVDAVIES